MSLILPKVENISWRCSLLTFLVSLPIWILVGGGLLLRPLLPGDLDLDLDLSLGFSTLLSSAALASLALLSFLGGEELGSFLSFFFLSLDLFDLSLDLDLLESELESEDDSELESLLELLLELESRLFLLLLLSLCFSLLFLLLSGLLSLPLSAFFFLSFSLPLSFSFPFSCPAILFR